MIITELPFCFHFTLCQFLWPNLSLSNKWHIHHRDIISTPNGIFGYDCAEMLTFLKLTCCFCILTYSKRQSCICLISTCCHFLQYFFFPYLYHPGTRLYFTSVRKCCSVFFPANKRVVNEHSSKPVWITESSDVGSVSEECCVMHNPFAKEHLSCSGNSSWSSTLHFMFVFVFSFHLSLICWAPKHKPTGINVR